MSHVLNQPSTTFVYSIESGYFEAQTLLAVESLRKFGGVFAKAPVLAVTPRLGPSLTSKTLRRMDELEITYVNSNLHHPDSWFCYMNKSLAVMLAEEYAKTEQIIWMDSDTLVIREPQGLYLEPGMDFAICSTDKNVGSSGKNDRNEPYWMALCDRFGIEIDDLPWITTSFEQQKVRFRIHSGVYAFRRDTGLGSKFVETCEQVLHSGVAYSERLPFPGDSVALAFAVILQKINWHLLPISYNYQITPDSKTYKRQELEHAHVLHYHHAFTKEEQCIWALKEIETQLPEVYFWLKEQLPLMPKIGGFQRQIVRRVLKEWRAIQQKRIESQSQKLVIG
jgi:hypothetical protein